MFLFVRMALEAWLRARHGTGSPLAAGTRAHLNKRSESGKGCVLLCLSGPLTRQEKRTCPPGQGPGDTEIEVAAGYYFTHDSSVLWTRELLDDKHRPTFDKQRSIVLLWEGNR
jgi:hypothetical protein